MGNDVDAGFRGGDDVKLTALITKIDDETFQQVLICAEDEGFLTAADYTTKYDLITALPELRDEDKAAFIDKLLAQ